MSQTTSQPISTEDWIKAGRDYKDALVARGQCCGPFYSANENAPLIWYDQVFEHNLQPAGTVNCAQALRVGQTNNGLDVILVAAHANEAPVVAAKDATVTVTLSQSDDMDGVFEEVGPTYCVKAPAEGISAPSCHLFARFPLGNFTKPWLRVKLEFAGTISGGNLDCALAYMPR